LQSEYTAGVDTISAAADAVAVTGVVHPTRALLTAMMGRGSGKEEGRLRGGKEEDAWR
jgi:hypothetical protein